MSYKNELLIKKRCLLFRQIDKIFDSEASGPYSLQNNQSSHLLDLCTTIGGKTLSSMFVRYLIYQSGLSWSFLNAFRI